MGFVGKFNNSHPGITTRDILNAIFLRAGPCHTEYTQRARATVAGKIIAIVPDPENLTPGHIEAAVGLLGRRRSLSLT